MTDTPEHIQNIQLEIWLSKPPMERLRQFLVDNGALYAAWDHAKQNLPKGQTDTENHSSIQ